MKISLQAIFSATAIAVAMAATVHTSPQDAPSAPATSAERVKERLARPAGPRLTPSAPVQLRPIFRSQVDGRPFVLTLEEDLHKTFDLNELQRQSAAWSSQCCGLDLGMVFRRIDKALDERRARKAREQVARELALIEAARAAAAAKR